MGLNPRKNKAIFKKNKGDLEPSGILCIYIYITYYNVDEFIPTKGKRWELIDPSTCQRGYTVVKIDG